MLPLQLIYQDAASGTMQYTHCNYIPVCFDTSSGEIKPVETEAMRHVTGETMGVLVPARGGLQVGYYIPRYLQKAVVTDEPLSTPGAVNPT